MSFFKSIEDSIANTNDVAYAKLEFYWGKELELFRPDKSDVYTKIHNKDSNSALKKIKSFVGITHMDTISVSDGYNQVNNAEGFLITQDSDVLVGDVIIFDGGGGRARFKIESHMDLGYNSTLYTKYSLSNMN